VARIFTNYGTVFYLILTSDKEEEGRLSCYVKLRPLDRKHLQEFVSEFLQFRVTVSFPPIFGPIIPYKQAG